MDFSSDANANFEGLLDVNREICMPQMAEKTSPDAPPNCAVLPKCFCDDTAQNRNFRTRKPAIRSRKSAVQPRISRHEYRMEGSFEHEEEYTDEYGD